MHIRPQKRDEKVNEIIINFKGHNEFERLTKNISNIIKNKPQIISDTISFSYPIINTVAETIQYLKYTWWEQSDDSYMQISLSKGNVKLNDKNKLTTTLSFKKYKHKITITNSSGMAWYNTNIFFSSSSSGESLVNLKEIGDINIGESYTVCSNAPYVYITAKKFNSEIITCKTKVAVDGQIILKLDDIITYVNK